MPFLNAMAKAARKKTMENKAATTSAITILSALVSDFFRQNTGRVISGVRNVITHIASPIKSMILSFIFNE